MFVTTKLLNDLPARGVRRNRVHVFDSLAQALQDFNAKAGVRVKKLPSKSVLKNAVAEELSHSRFSPELGEILEKNIQSLPSLQRIVFVLSDIEGRKRSEIAELLGISVKDVARHLELARFRLRELLNRYYKPQK